MVGGLKPSEKYTLLIREAASASEPSCIGESHNAPARQAVQRNFRRKGFTVRSTAWIG